MADERNLQITSRLPEPLRLRLDAINSRYNTTDAKNVVALLEAFATAVEEQDAVRFPVTVLLDDEKYSMIAEGKPSKPPRKGGRSRGAGPDADVQEPA